MQPKKIILTTPRLSLRRFIEKDTPLMAAISADKEVMRYFPSTVSLSDTQKMIRRINAHHTEHGFSLYAVEHKASETFIGFIGLNAPSFTIPHFTPSSLPIIEIGWRLAKSYWGKGYATEGAKAVLHHAFVHFRLKEIISFTATINTPSIRVMEKIGLTHDKTDDFIHPYLDKSSPLAPHVLYRTKADSSKLMAKPT
jgi:RimJ/RimL family protein N-acetyltransferase